MKSNIENDPYRVGDTDLPKEAVKELNRHAENLNTDLFKESSQAKKGKGSVEIERPDLAPLEGPRSH